MSKHTEARKVCKNGSDHFLSRADINYIKRAREIDQAQTNRRQAAFNKSDRRTKAGEVYTAHHQYGGHWS